MSDGQSDQSAAVQAQLIALYVLAEQTLIGGLSRILGAALTSTAARAAVLVKTRRMVRQVLQRLDVATPPLVMQLIRSEGSDGASAAVVPPRKDPLTSTAESVSRMGGKPPEPPEPPSPLAVPAAEEPFDFRKPQWERAVDAIEADLQSSLTDVRKRITRLDDDVYKLVAPQGAISQVTPNGETYVQAQREVFQDFLQRGVTGFTDKSGRDWTLSAYVEMAVRTASARAFNTAHLAVIQATGINLVTVSDDGTPCPLCFPWQNRVCCIVPDDVHPTIDDAIAAGLHHPNCRHTWVAVPDPLLLPEPEQWTPAMQARYDAGQKQRELERQIRKAKRRLDTAPDGEARQEARAKVRRAQQKLRDHLKANEHLKRDSRREQQHLTMNR